MTATGRYSRFGCPRFNYGSDCREIPDYETVDQVIRAVVGHNLLILACIYTNDSVSTLTRLTNLGFEPWLVSTAVNLIRAQRVLGKLCAECKKEAKIPLKVLI